MLRSFLAALLLLAPLAARADFTLDNKYAGEDKPKNHVWKRLGPKDKVVCAAWDDKATDKTESCVVKYASATERAIFKVEVKKGLLTQAGRPMDSTPSKMTDSPFYIFVEAPDGTFYASPVDKVGQVHHSTFLAGGPVKTAGEMKIKKGVLTELNNASGHYKPSAASTQQALADLKALGVNVKKVKTADITKGATH
jgi:hypothetical protein